MKLTRVDARKLLVDTHAISWDVIDSPGDHADGYNFYAEWSMSINDDFTLVPGIIDGSVGPLYIEHKIQHTPHDKTHIYRLTAVKKSDSSTIVSKLVFVNDDTDGVIKTIEYAERILYSRYIGEDTYFFKRKFTGTRCPECWNPYQFKVTKTNCHTCRGTGFVNGYYRPVKIQMTFEAQPRISDIQATGEIQTKVTNARFSSIPIMNARDLLVRKNSNDRYTIVRIDTTKLPNVSKGRDYPSNYSHVVSQVLTLKEVEPTDSAFEMTFLGEDVISFGAICSPQAASTSGEGVWSSTNHAGDAWIRNAVPEVVGGGYCENNAAGNAVCEPAQSSGEGLSSKVGMSESSTIDAEAVGFGNIDREGLSASVNTTPIILGLGSVGHYGQSSSVNATPIILGLGSVSHYGRSSSSSGVPTSQGVGVQVVPIPVISSTAPIDNTVAPDTKVSYTLSESCDSGSITWTWVGGVADSGSPHVQSLTV